MTHAVVIEHGSPYHGSNDLPARAVQPRTVKLVYPIHAVAEPREFRFSFHRLSRIVFTAVGLGWPRCSVTIEANRLLVRFGWGFIASIPIAAVVMAMPRSAKVYECGVHGFAGRWVVNGSHRGLVQLELAPVQRAVVGLVPVSVRRLTLSLEEPAAFLAALDTARSVPVS